MSDKIRTEVIAKLKELTNDFPDQGFVVVSVGEQHGREHITTFSNLPDESVQYVAALIIESGEETEKKARKRKKLH